MAIIYTYPIKTTSANRNDLILISDSADKNKTKQISVAKLPGGIDFVGVGGNGTAGKIPKWSTQYDLTDSSISEDSVTGNIGIGIQPNGSALATLDVSKNGLDTDQPIIRITQRKDDTGWPVAEMGRFEFFSSDGSGNSPYNLGYVGISNDYVGGTLPSGAMTFATTPYNATGGSEAAIERMRISSSGSVGIGTTSPAADGLEVANRAAVSGGNTQLFITGNTTGRSVLGLGDGANRFVQHILADHTQNAISFHTGATSVTTNERMRIASNGNVGIGTTNPAEKLEVSSNVANGGGQLAIVNTSQDATAVPTKRAEIIYRTTDTAGTIKDSAYVRVTPDTLNNVTGSSYAIWTRKGNTNPTESMRVDNTGNVGIGTTDPAEKLHVQNGKIRVNGSGANQIQLYRNPSTQSNYIDYYDTAAASPEAFVGYTSNNKDFKIYNSGASGTISFLTNSGTAMSVSNSGNVGIGNTNPNHKLTVGLLENETNIACASTGFDSLRLGTLTFPSAAGWYRVASYSAAGARGGARIDLCITGGAFAPVTYSIDYFKSYTQVGTEHTLKLEQYGGSAFITKARIAFDGTSTFVEVYKIATTAGNPPVPATMPAQVHFNRLIGESGGSLPMFGTATSGSGSTLLKEVFFIAKGTSVESLRVEGVCVIKNIKNLPTSASGLSTGDIWNNSGVLNIAP